MKPASVIPLPAKTAPPVVPPPPAPHRAVAVLASLWAQKWRALAIVLALVLALYFGPTLVLGPRIVAEPAVQGLFLQTVVASGHVEAPNRVTIGSQITGEVADVPVIEGQSVKADEALILLDDSELKAAVQQAEGVVGQAEARMRQMKELTLPAAEQALKQAQATLTSAQLAFDRSAKLLKDGYTTHAAVEETQRALDVAKAQEKSAEFQLATAKPSGSDYAMAQTQLAQAQSSLGIAQSRLHYTVIRAPRAGVLISRNVERGNTVSPASVLMVLSPEGEIQLVVQIDEKNLSLIATGQKALGSADSYAKETFPAEVFYINPGIDVARASVEVKLRVPKPPAYLRQDMTISVDIEVARREKAITLSAGSVRNLNQPKPFVLKVVNGKASRQDVTTGIVSGGQVEITKGLAAGDLVVPISASSIKDGSRVRASLPVVAAP